MQYLPLFLLFMAVLIAAYFYLERAKKRDAGHADATAASAATATEPETTSTPH